ncbi:MAG TPA: LUD domain-containing protein [Terracidiphilus sp.]|nr:LUD domain-containing protein [Terracidiphilus sp.]
MRTSQSGRDRVLDRIRAATATIARDGADGRSAYVDLPREYINRGNLSHAAKVALLIERLREYNAEVSECTPSTLTDAIHHKLAASNRRRFVAPPGLPSAWMVPGFDWKIDDELSYEQIEGVDGVVTGSFCAVADSGTIALHHSPIEGRRVLTLLPDWHLCIVYTSQVVETLPEYFARVEKLPTLVTWISGPSATADIEMTRIKGVHGPRHLNVILVQD